MQEELQELPPNVTVNWPSDNVALYDLIRLRPLFLNFISTAGREMALLGAPVLVHERNLAFPLDLFTTADSQASYFKTLEELSGSGAPSLERSVLAFRWHALELEASALDLGRSRLGISFSLPQSSAPWARVLHAIANHNPVVRDPTTLFESARRWSSLDNAELLDDMLAHNERTLAETRFRRGTMAGNDAAIERAHVKRTVDALLHTLKISPLAYWE
jgi:hypothetical protein